MFDQALSGTKHLPPSTWPEKEAIQMWLLKHKIDATWEQLNELALAVTAERWRLQSLINTPHTDDWFTAVRIEAAHQIERWGAEHDVGKSASDWFWLVGYLAGKALHAAIGNDAEKAKHHTISTGAALLNWHRAISGISNRMRPGIGDRT